MPTLEDLMGGGPRIPFKNLSSEGEFIKGVITDIDLQHHVWNAEAKKNMYWLDGRPQPVSKEEAEKAGLNKVTCVVVTLDTPDGLFKVDFNSRLAREALKDAVAAVGSFDVGDVLGKKHVGKEGRAYKYEVKIVKQGS